ncbi:MAG: hypothetical protein MJZ65_00595 [Paludibacteraceae bacterium]|nr:hypothetical protein [Paludibacteraceae bacterium]
MAVLPLQAQNSANRPTHYLALQLGGGEANNIMPHSDIKPDAGAAGNVAFLYEMHKGSFLFGLGVGAQYQFTGEKLDTYTESFARVDRSGEPVQYEYVYSPLNGREHDVRITVPVYFGLEWGSVGYTILGAKASYSLVSSSRTTADLLTQGVYAWGIEPIRTEGVNDCTPLGYYPKQGYASDDTYEECLWVALSLEAGAYLPININKVRMRIGAYAEYAFRIGSLPSLPIADYSKVDVSPYTQNMVDLQQNLLLNPVLNSSLISDRLHNMEVGIRWTVLFDVTHHTPPCHCMRD